MRRIVGSAFLIYLMLVVAPAAAQWPQQLAPGVPRKRDGQPNLSARAPRRADGKPDLSGIWQPDPGAEGTVGIGETVRSKYFLDVTAGLKAEDAPFQPAAEAVRKQRMARHSKEDPTARCLPTGVPALDTYPQPFKIIQAPTLIVVLYENNTTFRQIFMDGRSHPPDPQPTWMGYSIGKWEGDTLVVHSIGFNDRSWLDRTGHPHSDAMHVIERFRRVDFGHMEVHITINDPKTLKAPYTFTQLQQLLPDTELLEHYCNENEKDVAHFK